MDATDRHNLALLVMHDALTRESRTEYDEGLMVAEDEFMELGDDTYAGACRWWLLAEESYRRRVWLVTLI